jgi:glutamine amidotransferase PdxT
MDPLRAWTRANRPMFGTCAGLIMMANEVEGQKKVPSKECSILRFLSMRPNCI